MACTGECVSPMATIERTDTCTVCGAEFVVKPTHPMVENDQWCAECLPIVRKEALDNQTKRGTVDTALGTDKEDS